MSKTQGKNLKLTTSYSEMMKGCLTSHTVLMVYINISLFVVKLIGNQNKKMAGIGRQHVGKNQNLNGFRRVSKCHGSL